MSSRGRAATPEIVEEETTSALSGLTTQELAAQGDLAQGSRRPRQGHPRARRARCPIPARAARRQEGNPAGISRAEPAAGRSTRRRADTKWVHEIKHDGYRVQARIDGAKVQLLTRKGLDWTARFRSGARGAQDPRARAPPCSTARSWSRTVPATRAFRRCRPISARGAPTACATCCSTFSMPKGSTSPRARSATARRCCATCSSACGARNPALQRASRPGRADGVRARLAASGSKASCRSASTCRIGPGAATIG